jgi:hypothetical protein
MGMRIWDESFCLRTARVSTGQRSVTVNLKAMVRGTLDLFLMGGLVLGVMTLTGCGSASGGGGGTSATGALASGGATTLYAIQTNHDESNESILQFSLSGSGSVAPTSTLLPPATLVVGAVATDSAGQIYVGGNLNPGYVILVYAAGASGAATPLRTITLDAEGEFYPISMTVDASGKIYVAGSLEGSFSGVAVFDATANGAATPLQMIQNTDVQEPLSMAVDAAGKVYLSGLTETGGAILVFAAGSTGNVSPLQTISTIPATSTSVTAFWGLAVNGYGDLYTVQNTETADLSGHITGVTAEVEEFAAGATGSPAPIKTISGSKTGLAFGGGLRLDSAGNLYLANEVLSGNTVTYDLLGFGPSASGNVAPGVDLSSSSLTSPEPEIAVH